MDNNEGQFDEVRRMRSWVSEVEWQGELEWNPTVFQKGYFKTKNGQWRPL